MDLIQLCKWRYATKKMDPSKAVSEDKVERILEAVRLAPTSSGLQPFEVLLVTNPDVRAKIRPIAWDQSQIVDCSHLLVFAAWDNYTAERINGMFDLTNQVRGVTLERWEAYRKMVLANYGARSAEENFQHAARQAYVALGYATLAAAEQGVDCTPMEGFSNDALDEILDLRAKGLRSVLMLPLGYRDADDDWLVNLNKTRRPRAELVTEVK